MNILVLGDSHSKVFEICNRYMDGVYFDTVQAGGGTAYGLIHKNSKSRAYMLYTEKLKNEINQNKYDYVFMMLGEVDCGYVIWHRAEKHKISVVESLDQSLSSLDVFIKNEVIRNFDKSQIVLLAPPLQAIKEHKTCRIPARRLLYYISQYDRTLLTLIYITKLKHLAKENDYKFLEITEDLLDKKTYIIKDEFCVPGDNHLKLTLTRKFWQSKVLSFLKEEGRIP